MNEFKLVQEELDILYVKDVKALHKKAMEYFDLATVQQFNDDRKDAIENYQKALAFEKQAALIAQIDGIGEPSISILFRSAASIAIRANNFAEALDLARAGLSNATPPEIATELREIITDAGSRVYETMRRRDVPAEWETEFFYIGKKRQKIDLLSDIFDTGSGAAGMKKARIMLKNIIKRENQALPDVIFCEADFSFNEVSDFFKFLSQHRILSAIPFVLEAEGLSKAQTDMYRKKRVVDEIINLEAQTPEGLLKKVSFLKKIKAHIRRTELGVSGEAITVPSRMGVKYPIGKVVKRAFDIIVSLIALIALSPFIGLIALAIRIDSKGPIFYVSKRAGRAYKVFNFYKFRTMVADADKKLLKLEHLNPYSSNADGPVFFKVSNDPRITKLGSFLRNTSLDELPQLLNVLKGDMSLVGNRPLPLYEAACLTTDEWTQRFLAPAGITGLWQISKRGKKEMSVEERIELDINYAAKHNFFYDMWIIANTPSALRQKDNV